MGSSYSTQTNYAMLFEKRVKLSNTETPFKRLIYHKDGDPVIVSEDVFNDRLATKMRDFFTDFDWSNVILSGGTVLGALDKNELYRQYKYSDIDLFIYSLDPDVIINKIKYILEFFNKNSKFAIKDYYLYDKACTVEFLAGNFKFQLIGIKCEKDINVLENFDLTCNQVGFNGKDIVYTNDFVDAMITRETKTNKEIIQIYRIDKVLDRGFMIAPSSQKIIQANFAYVLTRDDSKDLSENYQKDNIRELKNLKMSHIDGTNANRGGEFDKILKLQKENHYKTIEDVMKNIKEKNIPKMFFGNMGDFLIDGVDNDKVKSE